MSNPEFERILLTGGNGFIGRYVVDRLVSEGIRPLLTRFNKFGPGRTDTDIIEVDLTDAAKTNELIRSYKPKIVLHLAGVTPGHSDPTGTIYHDVNFTATVNLLQSLANTDVRRIVLLGSAAEYGNQPIPFREDMPARPVSEYAISKAKANDFALEMHAANGLPLTILRVFTAYGYGQPAKMFCSQLITHALLNRHFKMSDGMQKRDFVYVADVASAIISAMTARNVVGRIINIAGGKGVCLRDLARRVWKICDADRDLLDIGSRERDGDDSFDTEADISRARELLTWRPGPGMLSESGISPELAETIREMQNAVSSALP